MELQLDYLSEKKAAEYSQVSLTTFRAKVHEYNIHPKWWMGKKIYRKADLQRAMEALWQR